MKYLARKYKSFFEKCVVAPISKCTIVFALLSAVTPYCIIETLISADRYFAMFLFP